jgi:hypothetical protein
MNMWNDVAELRILGLCMFMILLQAIQW